MRGAQTAGEGTNILVITFKFDINNCEWLVIRIDAVAFLNHNACGIVKHREDDAIPNFIRFCRVIIICVFESFLNLGSFLVVAGRDDAWLVVEMNSVFSTQPFKRPDALQCKK